MHKNFAAPNRPMTDTARQGERRSYWRFEFSERRWTWHVTRPDGTRTVSMDTFPTPQQCAEDAMKNGYVHWPTTQERRRSPAA